MQPAEFMADDELTDDDRNVVSVFKATMRELGGNGLVVLLRPKVFEAPTVFEGDVDVLYDPDRFGAVIRTAFEQAREHGINLLVEQAAPVKKCITFLSTPSSRRIVLELWPHAEVLPPGGRRARIVPWTAIVPRLQRDEQHQAVLPADVEAAFYLAHLHHKRKSLQHPQVRERLKHYQARLASVNGPAANALLLCVNGLLGSELDLRTGSGCATDALTTLGLPPRRGYRAAAARWRRRLSRAFRNRMPEPLVPVVGADGVGKTTLIELLTARTGLHAFTFKHAFRYSLAYRAFYAALGERGGMERNLRDEQLVHWLLLIARARWPIAAHRRRARAGAKRPVVVDRYFWDYLLKLRDSQRAPVRIRGYALYTWLTPTPRLAVVLMAKLATIFARKQELTSGAIDALYSVYCDQIARSGVDKVLFQSTDLPAERAAAEVAAFLGHS